MDEPRETIRLDKWLVFARFVRTRPLAVSLIEAGRIRLNGQKVSKPAQSVGPGDVLTLPLPGQVRVVRVRDCGLRRGPASEAALLYDEALD